MKIKLQNRLLSGVLFMAALGIAQAVWAVAPTITSTSPLRAAKTTYFYANTLTATGGVAPLTWTISAPGTLPAGVKLDPKTGTLYGTFSPAGVYTFSVTVTDSDIVPASDTKPFSVTVTNRATNTAPVLTDFTAMTGANEDTAFPITYEDLLANATWSDANTGDQIFFIVDYVNGKLSLNGVDIWADPLFPWPEPIIVMPGDVLSWTPSLDENGLLEAISFRACDSLPVDGDYLFGFGTTNVSAPASLFVDVAPINDPPACTNPPVLTAMPAVPFNPLASGASVFTGSAIGVERNLAPAESVTQLQNWALDWNDNADYVSNPAAVRKPFAPFTYQWQISTDGGTIYTDIPLAIGSTYTPVNTDATFLVRAAVICTDNGEGTPTHQSARAYSPPVLIVFRPDSSPVITDPSPVPDPIVMDINGSPLPFALTLTAADSDPTDIITWSIDTQATNGVASVSGTGTTKDISYVPNANWHGDDTFTVALNDGHSPVTTQVVNVRVVQTLTTIAVMPTQTTIGLGLSQKFTAIGIDQAGNAMVPQPAFTWGTSGTAGSIAPDLFDPTAIVYTAGGTAGTDTVTATVGSVIGTAAVTVANGAPTVVNPALATANPVTTTTTALSVLGDDVAGAGGEPALTYTWSVVGPQPLPPNQVTFDPLVTNGSNAAKNITATFATAGDYIFEVVITNPGTGLMTTSSVVVNVIQTLTSITVSPTNSTVVMGGTTTFTANGKDQFGNSMSPEPVVWSGTENFGTFTAATATYDAGLAAGSDDITATNGAVSGTTQITVVANTPPTVVNPAAAVPNIDPTMVDLSVLGTDDFTTPDLLVYSWAVVGTPPGSVSFSDNGNNTAKNTTATFLTAGTYEVQATITDEGGLSVTSSVIFTVNSTLTSIVVSPATPALALNATQLFTATGIDQFLTVMNPQPSFSWLVAPSDPLVPVAGSINLTSGVYTAGATGGVDIVTATDGSITGTTTVTVANGAPWVVSAANIAGGTPNTINNNGKFLAVLGGDDGGEANLTYTWATIAKPAGAADPIFSVNGTNPAKITEVTYYAAGSYTFEVTITDASGLFTTSSFTLTVPAVLTSIQVTPAAVTLDLNGGLTFTSTGTDQFGAPMIAVAMWSSTGVGAIDPLSGVYTAGSVPGTAVVTATSGTVTATAAVTVVNATPVVAVQPTATPNPVTAQTTILRVLGADDGGEAYLTYTWATISKPVGATDPVFGSGNGFNVGKTTTATFVEPGDYTFVVTIKDTANQAVTTLPLTVTVVDSAPVVAVRPSATPMTVVAKTTALSVLGADAGGEANLTYTWATVGVPPAAVTFSANGTNAAKNATATFTKAGVYNFIVTITDNNGTGLSCVSSPVTVTVNQTFTSLMVTPANITLGINGTQQFTATGKDQFGTVLDVQPAFAWTGAGVGAVNPTSGLYMAGTTTGMATVTASYAGKSASTNITVINNAPTVAVAATATPATVAGSTTLLNVLGADDNGELNLTYTWTATGPAPVKFSAGNGTRAAKTATAYFTKAGIYTFRVTISDGNLSVTSDVSVTVDQTLTTITVLPVRATIQTSSTQLFTATGKDQFGSDMATPPVFSWSNSGSGGIDVNTGLYTASTMANTATVSATSGGVLGTATVNTLLNAAPTVATAASATPNLVTGLTAALKVLGADDGGEAALIYTWATTGKPVGATDPVFSANSTNAAKNTTATFSMVGTYTFTVTITDALGLTVPSVVTTTINPQLKSIAVTPADAVLVGMGGTQPFVATGRDQFAANLVTQPAFAWSVSGVGSINSTSGLYTAGKVVGTATVMATFTAPGGRTTSGSASLTVQNAAPTVFTAAAATPATVIGTTTDLSVLGADADGTGEAGLSYTWSANGTAPVVFNYNGTNRAKNTTATFRKAGLYTFTVTIKDDSGLAVSSTVDVTVSQTPTSVTVSPASVALNLNGTQLFEAVSKDQFGDALVTQPAFGWTAGSGSFVGAQYTASTTAGVDTVTATAGAISGTATVTLTNAAPTVTTPATATPAVVPVNATTTTLSVLGADDGGEANLTYTWSAVGIPPAAVTFDANNGLNAGKSCVATFTKSGEYSLKVTISDGTFPVISYVTVKVSNGAPTVASSATANPATVTGTTTVLSVLGADDGGEVNLTYTWATSGVPPAPVSFGINGSNAAKNTIATFSKIGTYHFVVTITDSYGLTITTSPVTVEVSPTLTIAVSPASVALNLGALQTFTVSNATDQFGAGTALGVDRVWTCKGVGTLDQSGNYSAGTEVGYATISITSGGISGSASVLVYSASGFALATAVPAIVQGTTTQLDATIPSPELYTYKWEMVGDLPAPVTFSTSNSIKNPTATFSQSGNYLFAVVIRDAAATIVAISVVEVEVNIPPVNTVPPQVTGPCQLAGDTRTVNPGTWTGGSTGIPLTYTYAWRRADSVAGLNAADIAGATGAQYVLTAADLGKYICVVVTATDSGAPEPALASASLTTAWAAAGATQETFTLHLKAGWNLISLPVRPLHPQASEVFKPGLLSGPVWAYDSSKQAYFTETSIKPLVGYWIYVNYAYDVAVEGEVLFEKDTILYLNTGWNLVGPATDISVGATLTSVFTWNEVVFQSVTDMKRGKGYWIWVVAPTTLHTSPAP